MPFPVSPRYFLNFRNSDTGLTPTFLSFKNATTFANITPPTITESPAGGGSYYFDWTWSTSGDADIAFQVDGGASIPTEEVRYIKGTISPRDRFLDEPVSQVEADILGDTNSWPAGSKGNFINHIGVETDAVDASTVFGKVYKARDAIMGGTGFGGTGENIFTARDRIMGGTGFGGTGVDVKTAYDRIGAPLGGFVSIADQIGDPSGTNSIAQDLAAIQTSVGNVSTDLGLIKGAGFATGTDSLKVVSDTLDLVKAKTDNLPADPASQSTTNTSITNATTTIMGAGGPTLAQIGGATFNSSTDSLEAISNGIGALVAPDNASISSILTQVNKIGAVGDVSGASSIFGKIYEAKDSIKGGSPGVDLTQIAGAGFSSATMSLKATHDTLLRVTGMLHENSVLDGCTFDVNNNLTSGRLRLYTTSVDAVAAQAIPFPGTYDTNKIAEYTITATYTGSNLTTYLVTKV